LNAVEKDRKGKEGREISNSVRNFNSFCEDVAQMMAEDEHKDGQE